MLLKTESQTELQLARSAEARGGRRGVGFAGEPRRRKSAWAGDVLDVLICADEGGNVGAERADRVGSETFVGRARRVEDFRREREIIAFAKTE